MAVMCEAYFEDTYMGAEVSKTQTLNPKSQTLRFLSRTRT